MARHETTARAARPSPGLVTGREAALLDQRSAYRRGGQGTNIDVRAAYAA